MPINTDLNIAPYFDDFDEEKQFYRVLFKPGYAVQARELIQLQSILQNQVELFGDNIFKEGSIVKGCTFTILNGLQYVKLVDKAGFDPQAYIGGPTKENINGVEEDVDVVYEVTGSDTGLNARIISGSRGFETRPPDLNTFFISYIDNVASSARFTAGEVLTISRKKYIDESLYSTETNIGTINVSSQSGFVGNSFGIQVSPGIIFQKGHFLFAGEQTLVVSKYDSNPDDVSVGYKIAESIVTSLQDNTLYDNANGSSNENAPGADRLKMIPSLVVQDTTDADNDPDFFTLARYQNGSAVTLRDVSQYNVLGEEFARRTYEESGNYIIDHFNVTTTRRDNTLKALVGPGKAYVKGFRMENLGEIDLDIEDIANTAQVEYEDQPISLNYGGYVDITSLAGTVDIDYRTPADLKDSTNTKIGEAFVRNITPEKLYIAGIQMNVGQEFASVNKVEGPTGFIHISNNSILQEASTSAFIFDNGQISTKEYEEVSVPFRVKATNQAVVTNNIQITVTGSYDLRCDNDDIVVIDESNDTLIPVTSTTTSLNYSVIDIALGSTPAGNCTVYYNRRTQLSQPWTKNLVEPWIQFTYAESTDKYSLGLPDVFKIISIEDASGTDFTNSFRLVPNQKDNYYDISYIEKIPGRAVPPAGALYVNFKTYQLSDTGEMYFTYDSYPVDDDSPYAAGSVRSDDIPVYVGANGKRYNLRECFDFRPYMDKDSSASYTALTKGAAPTITSTPDEYTPTFTAATGSAVPATEYVVPSVDNEITAGFLRTYPSRIDVITADAYGEIAIVKGQAKEFPVPPKVGDDQMVINEVFIPGRPALTMTEASQQMKPEHAVRLERKGVTNYTMKDISKIERKVESLEYYVTLNQIEQEVENLNIVDENGLTRFKNGYIVDGFNNLSLANLEDPQFNAAVAFDEKVLTPSVRTFPIDIKYSSSLGSTLFPSTAFPEVGSLSRNAHVSLVNQPYATNSRNCVSNFYKYNGSGALSPNHDAVHDTVADPVPNLIDNAVADITQTFVDNLQTFFPLTGTNQAGQVWPDPNDNPPSTQEAGDFVINPQFLPYMRGRDIRVYIAGLRPNTRHYFFFDKVDVNSNVAPGTAEDEARSVLRSGAFGSAVSSDSNGVLRAIFRLPAETFFVGQRNLEITDVTDHNDIESAGTSYGVLAYHAYNISLSSLSSTSSTRIPQVESALTQTLRNLSNRIFALEQQRLRQRTDPLAQTFFVKKGMGRGSNTVFASKVDLYFKRKSETNGVSVMLREVSNGFPTAEIIPFSKVHLLPSAINVSDDASVATSIDFEAPVRLDVEKEYALVIQPDANDPNYLVYISKVGGTDITAGAETQGEQVTQDWGDGVLFTSTNNRAWKSYQDEDLKFNLYRHDFNSSTGTITFEAPDQEFFTFTSWDGSFQPGEEVYQELALTGNTSPTVTVVAGSTSVAGTDLDDTFTNGDWIKLTTNGGGLEEIVQIESVDDANTLTIDRPSTNNVLAGTIDLIVKGEVDHVDARQPDKLHLRNSTASSTRAFSNTTIYGVDSSAEAMIDTVDNINLSFVQPLINKTNDAVTSTLMSGTFVDPADVLTSYNEPMDFAQNNHFNRKGLVLYSKSNDPSGTKPFNIKISMANNSNATSTPLVDIQTAALLAYQFNITNDSATTSKFISRTIELAEDIDAEDFQVYLTGYRPRLTDIKVYVKVQNSYDSANFASLDWIELELIKGKNLYSSTANMKDFKDYRYRVPAANLNSDDIIEYTSSAGTFASYRKFAVKIELLSPNIHSVPMVADYRGIALT